MSFPLYNIIKEMLYTTGPRQVYNEGRHGKISRVRRALDWEGNVVQDLLVTDSERFCIKYNERGPGVVV